MSMTKGTVASRSEPRAGGAARFPREERWRAEESEPAQAYVPRILGVDIGRLPLYAPGRSGRAAEGGRNGPAQRVASEVGEREDAARTMEPALTRAPSGRPSPGGQAGRVGGAALGTRHGVLQAKLAVGSVEDPLEQEADRVADKVLRMPDPVAAAGAPVEPPGLPVTPSGARLSRKCASCKGDEDEKGVKVQRRAAPGAGEGLAEAPPIVEQALGGGGRPLDAPTRAYFEPRFGFDLSKIRIHADARAQESARSVNALAYTVGRDIVFGQGRYAPERGEGRRLLAHELAHVAQQGSVAARPQGGAVAVSPVSPRVARAPASDVDPVHEKMLPALAKAATGDAGKRAAVIELFTGVTADQALKTVNRFNRYRDAFSQYFWRSVSEALRQEIIKILVDKVGPDGPVPKAPPGQGAAAGGAPGAPAQGQQPVRKDSATAAPPAAGKTDVGASTRRLARTIKQPTQVPKEPGGVSKINVLGGDAVLPIGTLVEITGEASGLWSPIVVKDPPFAGKPAGWVQTEFLKDEPKKEATPPEASGTPKSEAAAQAAGKQPVDKAAEEASAAHSDAISKAIPAGQFADIFRELDMHDMAPMLGILDRLSAAEIGTLLENLHEPHTNGRFIERLRAALSVVQIGKGSGVDLAAVTSGVEVIKQPKQTEAIVAYLRAHSTGDSAKTLLGMLAPQAEAGKEAGGTAEDGVLAAFKRAVRAKAIAVLDGNLAVVDNEELKYKDTGEDSAAWATLRKNLVPLIQADRKLKEAAEHYDGEANKAMVVLSRIQGSKGEDGTASGGPASAVDRAKEYEAQNPGLGAGGAPATSAGTGGAASREMHDPTAQRVVDELTATSARWRSMASDAKEARSRLHQRYPILAASDVLGDEASRAEASAAAAAANTAVGSGDSSSGGPTRGPLSNEELFQRIRMSTFDSIRDAIAKTKSRIQGDSVPLDQLEPIVRQVMEEMHLDEPGHEKDKSVIDGWIEQTRASEATIQILVAGVAVLLGVAAMLTGGVAGAFLSLASAVTGFGGAAWNLSQASGMKDAATAGDIGQPLLDDPEAAKTAYYAAVIDFIQAGFGVAEALVQASAAVAAKKASEAARAAEKGADAEAKGAAAEAKGAVAGAKGEGAAARDAKAAEGAAAGSAEVAKPSGRLQIPEAESEVGRLGRRTTADAAHELKVTAQGDVIRCSPVCTRLRDVYDAEIKADSKLAAEIDRIERDAAAAARSKNAQAAEAVLDRAVAVEQRLKLAREGDLRKAFPNLTDAHVKALRANGIDSPMFADLMAAGAGKTPPLTVEDAVLIAEVGGYRGVRDATASLKAEGGTVEHALQAAGDAAGKQMGIRPPKSVHRLKEKVKNFEGATLDEAYASALMDARIQSSLGANEIPFVQDIGVQKGKISGRMAPDGSHGWRLDFDSETDKQFHINWWRTEAEYHQGANVVVGADEAFYLKLLERLQ